MADPDAAKGGKGLLEGRELLRRRQAQKADIPHPGGEGIPLSPAAPALPPQAAVCEAYPAIGIVIPLDGQKAFQGPQRVSCAVLGFRLFIPPADLDHQGGQFFLRPLLGTAQGAVLREEKELAGEGGKLGLQSGGLSGEAAALFGTLFGQQAFRPVRPGLRHHFGPVAGLPAGKPAGHRREDQHRRGTEDEGLKSRPHPPAFEIGGAEEEASAQPLRLKAAGDDGETGFVCSCHGKTHSFVVRRGKPRPFSLFRPDRTGKRLSAENPFPFDKACKRAKAA